MRGAAETPLLSHFLAIKPVPASRPRVGRWGTYYAPTYKKFKKAALPLAESFSGEPTGRPVIMMIQALVRRPKTSKLLFPSPDVDNLSKAALDALTQAQKFYTDDKLVVGLFAFKRWAKEDEEEGLRIHWFTL